MKYAVVVAWHNQEQVHAFWDAWGLSKDKPRPEWLIFQQDTDREGCAVTKNRGIKRALDAGAEYIVVLDDDCFPVWDMYKHDRFRPTLEQFANEHIEALQPKPVQLFEAITDPPSRGTPYYERSITLPVALSMGFWTGTPDLDAPSQLRWGTKDSMTFKRHPVYGRYVPISGMNIAFHRDWAEWCQFINVERMDDIWMGLLLQKHAYETGHCINLGGPLVYHSRQSNVWHNLKVEAENLELNETLWQSVFSAPAGLSYEDLKEHVGL